MLGEEEAKRHAAIVILGAAPVGPPLAACPPGQLGTRRGQQFMNVHEADGVFWLNSGATRARALHRRARRRDGIVSHGRAAGHHQVIELAKREGYSSGDRVGPEALAPVASA